MAKKSCRAIDVIDLTGEVAEAAQVEPSLASRVISMFEEGFTVPFIARYRKEATGGLEPPVLHRLKEKMAECKVLIEKIDKSFQYLDKKGLLTDELSKQLLQCKTTDEVNFITEPLKSKGPRTLCAKAKAANLESLALELLYSGKYVDIVRRAPAEARQTFSTESALLEAVSHIVADVFAKDLDLFRQAEHLCSVHSPTIHTTRKKTKESKPENGPEPMNLDDGYDGATSSEKNRTGSKCSTGGGPAASRQHRDDLVTFKMYLDFTRPLAALHAHQILAINRAVERGVISVKITTHPRVEAETRQLLTQKYFGSCNRGHWDFIHTCFTDSWKRLIEPHLVRSMRTKLTSKAQDTSLEVFAENFRRLLMTAPLRARSQNLPTTGVVSSSVAAPGDRLPVVGLDPGWVHGCKWAACGPHGDVLATGILWPPIRTNRPPCSGGGGPRMKGSAMSFGQTDNGLATLTAVMQRHNIETIALGNGQASRETGMWLSNLISIGHFQPLAVRYAIVPESGASVYSASQLACTELSQLDVSLRGAVSIARRLQDPLAEWVKMDPKHVGVGMYQHDLPERRLVTAVNGIMEECISFVGVDVNAAPLHILARVAGLSEAKAKAIVSHRSQIGAFHTRADLCKVKGIGKTTYAQCAGFIRIRPTVSTIPLDGSKDAEMISIPSDDDDDNAENGKPRVGAALGSKRKRPAPGPSIAPSKAKRARQRPNVDPSTFNPLDQTAVHPDAYDVATAIITSLNCCLTDVGFPKLRDAATRLWRSENRDEQLKRFCTSTIGLDTLRDIVESLARPLDFDERQDYFLPLFHSSATSIDSLRRGMHVTGRVENVTTFGAFCDIGVQQHAYIPRHAYPQSQSTVVTAAAQQLSAAANSARTGLFTLRLGDRIAGFVSEVNTAQGRITLERVSVLPPSATFPLGTESVVMSVDS